MRALPCDPSGSAFRVAYRTVQPGLAGSILLLDPIPHLDEQGHLQGWHSLA